MNDATLSDRIEALKPERWWRPDNEFSGLNPHLADKLIGVGLRTAEDLRQAGPKRILEIDGVGKVALEEIKSWLCALDER